MELYSFYRAASYIAPLWLKNVKILPIVSAAIGLVIWSALFLLQAFALRRMAINRGMKKSWMAFVPFVNILYIGKLAGECSFFGNKVKRAGLYMMLAQLVCTISTLGLIGMEVYLFMYHGKPNEYGSWVGLQGFAGKIATVHELNFYLLSIVQLVYEIFLLVLVMGLYRRYAPKNYMGLSFLTLFLPISRYIVIFVLRKRISIDYEAYMRAQREAYMRRQQQYYNQRQNPYGNPYGSPYGNPYNSSWQRPNTQTPKNENPFEEFSTPNEEGSTGDGFFD